MKRLLYITFLSLLALRIRGQVSSTRPVDSVRLITSDIDRFWRMYHQLSTASTTADSLQLIHTLYLDTPSHVLEDRIKEEGGEMALSLLNAVRAHPKYIASIEESSRRIGQYRQVILAAFRKLRQYYPRAVLPDFCFVIGDFESGGTPEPHGMMIGAEIVAASDNSPVEEFAGVPGLKYGISPVDRIDAICSHEIVHWQQAKPTQDLLWLSLREGAADFIGEKLCGKTIDPQQLAYGRAQAAQVWRLFVADTAANAIPNWLFNGGRTDLSIPPNMGYYIGYRICEVYYNKASNKPKAIQDILSIKDPRQFLYRSGYSPITH
jgi:hypothetical protein